MKMKKLFTRILFAALGVFMYTAAFAAGEHGTPDEAIAMVKKAVAYYKANGREKAFAEFNNSKGQFVDRDMYIMVLDSNIVVLAHGANPRIIGKNVLDSKDADGKAFAREFYEIANKKGKAWVDYKWPNPVTKAIESKSTYVETVDGILIGCGIYKK